MTVSIDDARELAKTFLVFLTEDPERLGRFLSLTGVGPADIRARLDDDAFLGGLLDHLLSDEPLLLSFCEAKNMNPETPARLRHRLPGALVE